jgi:hypothetical protein
VNWNEAEQQTNSSCVQIQAHQVVFDVTFNLMAPKCSVESCACFEDLLKAVSFSEMPGLLADIRPRLPIVHYVVPACSHWWFEITMSSIADLFIHFQLDDLRLAPNYPNPPALSVALRCGLHSAHAPAWSSNWISRTSEAKGDIRLALCHLQWPARAQLPFAAFFCLRGQCSN